MRLTTQIRVTLSEGALGHSASDYGKAFKELFTNKPPTEEEEKKTREANRRKEEPLRVSKFKWGEPESQPA